MRAFVLNDTRVDRHHGCWLVMDSIIRLLGSQGLDILGTFPAHRDWRSDQRAMELMRTADLLVVNGEGTLHHSAPSGKPLLDVGEFANRHGLTSALINASWSQNSEDYLELARSFSFITVREPKSQNELGVAGIDSTVLPDLSSRYISMIDADRSGIIVGDSVLDSVSRELDILAEDIDAPRISMLNLRRGLIDRLRVARFERSRGVSAWQWAAREFGPRAVRRTGEASDFLSWLRGAELVISGRFHTIVLCIATGTPFIAAPSNSHKIPSMLGMIGMPDRFVESVADIDRLKIGELKRWRYDERERLESFIDRARRDVDDWFRALAEHVSGRVGVRS